MVDKVFEETVKSLPRRHKIGMTVFGVVIGFVAKEMAERLYVETLMDYMAKRASK